MTIRLAYKQIFSLLSYVLIASVIAYLIIDRHGPSLKNGVKAPLNTVLVTPENQKIKFNSLTKKGAVINFWATWCPPCQKELPVLSKLSKEFDSKIAFIGAVVDSPFEEVEQLQKEFELNYLLGNVDNKVIQKWQAFTLPTTYIVNKFGKVVYTKVGMVSEMELKEAINDAIKKS